MWCFHPHRLWLWSNPRYDVFIIEEYWTVVGSPDALYKSFAELLRSKFKPVLLEDALWLDDPYLLSEEMKDKANTQSPYGQGNADLPSLDDWTPLLSNEEMNNYKGYLKNLGMDQLPPKERPLRAVAVGQSPDEFPMQSTEGGVCCAFTKTSTARIMITGKERWISACEKMAMFGFPVNKDIL